MPSRYWVPENLNPYKKEVGDCTIRAIAKIQGWSWDEAFDAIIKKARKMADVPSSDTVWGSLLYDLGFERKTAPNYCKYGKCYTVNDFADEHRFDKYLICPKEHVVALIDGLFYDTWDCGNKIVLFYWERGGK